MKTLTNKQTSIPMGEGKTATYADLIKVVCNQQVQGGYSMTDITQRSAIIKECENANGVISLEDARVDYLKAITSTSKWAVIHEGLIEFSEDIKNGWTKS